MFRLSTLLAFVFASILPLAASRAEGDRYDGPPVSYSCFQSPDYCLKNFARTHDREVYDLCLLSEKVCRTYQYNWKVMRSRLERSPGVLSDCFPVISVESLLRLCKGEEGQEKDACRQNLDTLRARTNLAGKSWRSWTKNQMPMFCPKADSISDAEFVEAFVDWAEKHPSQKDLDADAAIIEATAAAWPCPGATIKWRRSH